MTRHACPVSVKRLQRECGAHQAVLVGCGKPSCPKCERQRAKDAQRRYSAGLRAWKHPKLLTLTIRSSYELAPQIADISSAFRTLLETRLGSRARAHLAARIETYLTSERIDRRTGQTIPRFNEAQRAKHRASVARFMADVQAEETAFKAQRPDAQFKLRHLFDGGLSALEVTVNRDTAWHAHRHVAVDCPTFIPQIALSVLWMTATNGAGSMVDVRELKDKGGKPWHYELLKYVAKTSNMTDSQKDELDSALFGRKRLWAFAGFKPSDEPRQCPHCGKATPDKQHHHDGSMCSCEDFGPLMPEQHIMPGVFVVRLPEASHAPAVVTVSRDDKNRLVWTSDAITEERYEALKAERVSIDLGYLVAERRPFRRAIALPYQEKGAALGTNEPSAGPPEGEFAECEVYT